MSARHRVRLLMFTGASSWGGAEIVLGHLLGALGEHVRPTLLGVDAAVVQRLAARRPGLEWSIVPPIMSKRDLVAMRTHRSAIVSAESDIVQVNLPVPYAEPYTVLAALTVPRVRVVVVEHLPMAFPSRGRLLLKRLTTPRLAAHLAVGRETARQVEQLSNLRTGAVRVVPNGVPPPSGYPGIRPRDAEFVVGGIGRLHAQKGFDVLIRAVAGLPGTQLILVGDGPERDALRILADDLGVGNRVSITGWSEAPTAYLSIFDVVAVPSRYEGLPLVLLEAMHAGCAVVATPVGSMCDGLRHGETGLLVGVNDVEGLRAALQRLQDDPPLRRRLGASAAALAARHFTATAMARRYEQVYDELLERTRQRPGPLRSTGRRDGREPLC